MSAREARDAAQVVKGINDRIGRWQAESVRLAAAARRMKQSNRHEPGVVEAIGAMVAMIERQRHEFAALLVDLPDGVAQHSRIHDTGRALNMILARLHEASPE